MLIWLSKNVKCNNKRKTLERRCTIYKLKRYIGLLAVNVIYRSTHYLKAKLWKHWSCCLTCLIQSGNTTVMYKVLILLPLKPMPRQPTGISLNVMLAEWSPNSHLKSSSSSVDVQQVYINTLVWYSLMSKTQPIIKYSTFYLYVYLYITTTSSK